MTGDDVKKIELLIVILAVTQKRLMSHARDDWACLREEKRNICKNVPLFTNYNIITFLLF